MENTQEQERKSTSENKLTFSLNTYKRYVMITKQNTIYNRSQHIQHKKDRKQDIARLREEIKQLQEDNKTKFYGNIPTMKDFKDKTRQDRERFKDRYIIEENKDTKMIQ